MRIARVVIKVVLVVAIVLFALFNYKIITFKHGISRHHVDGNNVLESLQTLKNVRSVKYYDKIVKSKSDSNIYRIFIETDTDAYLLDANQSDLEAFDIVGGFGSRYKPQQIKPIPFYVEIIVGLLVVLFPPIDLVKKILGKIKSPNSKSQNSKTTNKAKATNKKK
ncbi:MAG: hypothetical protein J1G02_05780 [Clostridiales bacterium]|nr:hypothetical protein [Clostridiales bacterium]